MKRKFEDKIIKIIDKLKFSQRVFSVILGNCVMFKILILNNNKKIHIGEITNRYSFLNACIQKYEDMIVSFRKQKKPTKLFQDELDKNRNLLIECENELIKVLEKELPFIKEIVMNNGTHLIINNKMFHSLEGPCVYSDDLENNNSMYYINDELLDEDIWNKNPLVREVKIKKILKKSKKKYHN